MKQKNVPIIITLNQDPKSPCGVAIRAGLQFVAEEASLTYSCTQLRAVLTRTLSNLY